MAEQSQVEGGDAAPVVAAAAVVAPTTTEAPAVTAAAPLPALMGGEGISR
jgi:hypothetical protein